MTRHGEPIGHYLIRNPVNTGIAFSFAFEEFEACIAAGLDLSKWETGKYSTLFKSQVVAWYRLHTMVEVHTEAARQEKSERLAARARRRR